MRTEAEGAAADLLRIARQHARDHKDRVRAFIGDRFQDIKSTFNAEVSRYDESCLWGIVLLTRLGVAQVQG